MTRPDVRRTVTIYDDHSVEERDDAKCKSPHGDHVFVMGQVKCVYCSAERRPR